MKKSTFLRTVILMSLILFTHSLFSQTHVSGTIDGKTWSKSGSPYIVDDDLFIANLAIEPGVKVICNGDYVIEVAGLLKAIGTEQEPILFTTMETITGWQGIFFNITTFNSILRYCDIENSKNSGVRVINSTPTIDNCVFSNNSASQGGAIYFLNDSEVGSEFTLSDCSFYNNKSLGHGGALYVSLNGGNLILTNSIFEKNLSNPSQATGNYVGGALALSKGDATIMYNKFFGNRVDSRCAGTFDCSVNARGGAIYLGSSGNVKISNNIFSENQTHATNSGNCFFGGSSLSYGGAIYVNLGTVILSNNIIANNRTTRTNCGPSVAGGGVYVNGGTVTMANCNVIYNPDATGIHCAGGTLDVINSIIFFNNKESTQIGGNCTVTYSDIQDSYTGEGNISNNPTFIKDDIQFHLTSISPCIDAGNTDEIYKDVCFPPSFGSERNDIGAYGGPGACDWSEIISNRTNFLSFDFPEKLYPAIIDMVSHSINIELMDGTDLTQLVSTFKLSSGATAKINGVTQVSGITENDFSNSVTYMVIAENGTTIQNWVVTATTNSDKNDETEILTYSFGTPPQTGDATINTTAKTIDIEVENGTDLTKLVSTFTLSDGATAKVGTEAQVSGTTANDFTSPVTYKVTAEDGTTVQNWVVTVTVAPFINNKAEILTYGFGIHHKQAMQQSMQPQKPLTLKLKTEQI